MNPNEDGLTHINIYSKGKTELGRLLSNFAHTPFVHPKYGKFASIEGFWYWITTDSRNPLRDNLRLFWGWKAKEAGRELRGLDWPKGKNFEAEIKIAMMSKIASNPRLKELLKESELPFEHYYVYGNKVVEVKDGKWILEFWTKIRERMKNGWLLFEE